MMQETDAVSSQPGTLHSAINSSGLSAGEAVLGDGRLPSGPLRDYVLSVVIPVYNEKNTLLDIIARVRAVEIPKEIIMVDDGSTDGTRDVFKNDVEGRFPDVRVYYHDVNRGKGSCNPHRHRTRDRRFCRGAGRRLGIRPPRILPVIGTAP